MQTQGLLNATAITFACTTAKTASMMSTTIKHTASSPKRIKWRNHLKSVPAVIAAIFVIATSQ